MEEKKNSLVVSNARMRKELQDLEDQILFMLSNSTGNILDDHKLIETLATSKVKSQEITAKVNYYLFWPHFPLQILECNIFAFFCY